MVSLRNVSRCAGAWVVLGTLVLLTVGCPQTGDYDAGFAVGFAKDDWYWKGYDDSDATLNYDPIYYQGGTIDQVESPEYDRGYWDGIWYAYNDGYFVCYDYAFTIGFSEGYDAAYFNGYLDFLKNDVHIENDNGGWGDGYNDGFSEGRVFGASDFEQGLVFDWMDAMNDYRGGTDLNFAEIAVGTGTYGPVLIYAYGTDPLATSKARRAPAPRPAIRIAGAGKATDPPAISYRPLVDKVKTELGKDPTSTPRSKRPLTLATTWLQRVEAYRATIKPAAKSLRARAVNPD